MCRSFVRGEGRSKREEERNEREQCVRQAKSRFQKKFIKNKALEYGAYVPGGGVDCWLL